MAERVGCEDSDVFALGRANTACLRAVFEMNGSKPRPASSRDMACKILAPPASSRRLWVSAVGRIVMRSKFLDFEDSDKVHLATLQCLTFTIACGTIACGLKAARNSPQSVTMAPEARGLVSNFWRFNL